MPGRNDARNVIETHERASPYLSTVFGPDETMSFLETRIESYFLLSSIVRFASDPASGFEDRNND
jgi:hypothetical protein